MVLTTHSTPDSLLPSSPGYHELQSYSRELPVGLGLQYYVSQTVPADEPRLATIAAGPIARAGNEYDRQQGRFESPIYPRSELNDRDFVSSSDVAQLGHSPSENPSRSYFSFPDHQNRAGGSSLQYIYLLSDCLSDADPQTTAPYYL